MSSGHKLQIRNQGFTLVELVVILTIIGILAVVTIPKLVDRGSFVARGFYDETVAALRYGGKIAVASGCPVLVILASNRFSLWQQAPAGNHCNPTDNSYPTPVLRPDNGQPFADTAPSGVTISNPVRFVFTPLGSTSLGSNITVNIGSNSFTIHAGSGYVQ